MRSAAARDAGDSERSLKDRAHRLLSRGNAEGALRLYRELLDRNRADATLWLRHAELCQRLGRVKEAVSSYHTAAERFSAAGHAQQLRTGAHQRVTRVGPPRRPVRLG